MAKPSTTHVIEIETGIGEPAFIPLTQGQELQPISIGKKGMWRIESARVLDIHAFVYFDGAALFIQSADESKAASVDGYRVGKAWTKLHAPCKIEIGAARLRFRSLVAAKEDSGEMKTEHYARRPKAEAAEPPQPPPPKPADPIVLPKAERPFRPGAFSGPPQEESTRVAPLEPSARSGTGPPPAFPAPRPAAGRRVEEEPSLRSEHSTRQSGSPGPATAGPGAGMAPAPPHPHGGASGMRGPSMIPSQGASLKPPTAGAFPPGMPLPAGMPPQLANNLGMQHAPVPGMPAGSIPPAMPAGAAYPQPYPGSGSYHALDRGPSQSGGYGSMTGEPLGGPPEATAPGIVARYKELTLPKKLLLILSPFCLISAAYLLLFDETTGSSTAADTGADTRSANASTAPTAKPPVQPACPAGFVPYSEPINGLIPCVPAGTPMPGASGLAASQTPPQPPAPSHPPMPTDPPPAPPPVTTGGKTLERQAVDYVAVGNYAAAAAIYAQLHQQNPSNGVYGEAARILNAKADAGTP